MTTPSLPIIDLAALKEHPAARSQMLAQLGQAAREVGFFYLVGHDLRRIGAPGDPGARRPLLRPAT